MITPDQYKFDPSKVRIVRKFIKNKARQGMLSPMLHGPYWYAMWMEDGKFLSQYIGKELPPDLEPYADKAKPLTYKRRLPMDSLREYNYQTVLQALNQGDGILIDVFEIANQCRAQVDEIGHGKFHLYR